MKLNTNIYTQNIANCFSKYLSRPYMNYFNLYKDNIKIKEKFNSYIFECILNKINNNKQGPLDDYYNYNNINNYRLKVVKLFMENKL